MEFSSGVSGGNFIEGEEIYVGATADQQHAYGQVDSWTVPATGNKYVTVNTVKGSFEIGDVVHGKTSLAQYTILAVSDTDTRASSPNTQDNEAIDLETNRDNIFDFTERDPFSEGNY